MRKITLCFVVLLYSLSAFSQDRVCERIIELGKSENQSMRHLDILSNRIGGRVLGSSNYDIAVQWAAGEFKKWGLEVSVEQAGVMPVGFNRGPWFGKMLSEDGLNLHFVTPSYTAGTKGVQRGHVLLEPKTQADFDRMKGVLKGAWVLIGGQSRGWPIDRSYKGDSIRKAVLAENQIIKLKNDSISQINWKNRQVEQLPLVEYRQEPALLYKEMVEAGVLGFIQSAPVPLVALYDRLCLDSMTFDNLPQVPDIKLDEAQYKIIAEKAKRRDYFQLEFDIRNHFRPGPIPYHNVIGIIRGSEKPNEYVMSGGHLDAFDVATGGVDCGSGITPNMEAARLIAKACEGKKPKRTILICLWAGEEFGLLGSKAWVEQHKGELKNISNYFNRDGGPTVANGITVTPKMYDTFKPIAQIINKINPEFPFNLKVRQTEPTPIPKNAGGSDHAYFMLNGVPTLSFATADPMGYNFSYGEIWHTERDLYNKSIAPYQEHTAIVTAVTLWELANSKNILTREGLFKTE